MAVILGILFVAFFGPAFAGSSDAKKSEAQKPVDGINAIFDGKDPVRMQMLKTIAAFESHNAPEVVKQADETLALNQNKKVLKPRELGLVYSMKGIGYLFLGQTKKALPILEKAAELTKDSRTLYNLACAQSALGQLPRAEASFREALESGARDSRFGSAEYYIEESKSDDQLVALRARPAYTEIIRDFRKRK